MTYQFGDLILEKYRVEVILGQGAFGDVYRVSNQETDAPRVVRVYNRHDPSRKKTSFEKARLRYTMEAELSERFNTPKANPHLLHVFGLNETKDELVLEMDYAPGGNLIDRMSEFKSKGIPFPREKALRIAYEIASGLSAMHVLDIVHGNIKPTNILFNQKHTACLSDLGLSQIPSSLFSSEPQDLPRLRPETHAYMSPEQLLSLDRISPASDIYSLGMVLFEMLTGRTLISAGPRTRLSDFIPGVRPSLDELLARMLSEQPGNRLPNARTLALDLVKELDAEELALMEIQAKRRREQEDWERLKTEELVRQKSRQNTQPIIKERRKLEQTALNVPFQQPDSIASVSMESPAIMDSEPQAPVSGTANNHPAKSRAYINKVAKFGLPVVIALAIVGGIYAFTNRSANTPLSNTEVVAEQPESPIPDISSNTPTNSLVAPATTNIQPAVGEIVETPVLLNTIPAAPVSIENPSAIPPVDPEVMVNAGFEDNSSWRLKIGDDHIVGDYSDQWSSEGKRSYRFQLFGNSVYEYCLTPGMRTSVNQTVDLTDVDEIMFDMVFQPPVVSQAFRGDVINTSAIVFIDGEMVFETTDDNPQPRLDQQILLNDRYPGKHDLKFGLMVKSKFCVKGNSEAESLFRYFDNIRFRYN